MAQKVKNLNLRREAGDQRGKVRAAWSAMSSTAKATHTYIASKGGKKASHSKTLRAATEKYEYRVDYDKLVIGANGKYAVRTFKGTWQSTTSTAIEVSVPDGATNVVVHVRPVSKKYKYYKDSKATSPKEARWYEAASASAQINTGAFHSPQRPTVGEPQVADDGVTVAVALSDDDPYTAVFFAEALSGGKVVATARVAAKEDTKTFASKGTALLRCPEGSEVKVRARMQNVLGRQKNTTTDYTSAWVSHPTAVRTKPPRVSGVSAAATAQGTARVKWAAAAGAEWYELAWANSASAFSLSSGVQTKSTADSADPASLSMDFDDLETGKSWFFWVRACNASGDGAWSDASAEVRLGSRPAAPTVWADAYAAIRGDTVRIGWAHNSTDGSAQSRAQVLVRRGVGSAWEAHEAAGSASTWELDTSGIPDGTTVEFYVRTWGIVPGESGASPASETRAVRVWERPGAEIDVAGTVERFPLRLTADAVSASQVPVTATVRITAAAEHFLVATDGTERRVAAGETVWERTWQRPPDPLPVELTAGDVMIASGQSYTAHVDYAMSSGLACGASRSFAADLVPSDFEIEASLSEHGPYGCEIEFAAYGPPEGEREEAGDDGDPVAVGTPVLAEGVTLAVYRHETDGTMTPLMANVPNDGTYSLVDDHAAFGRQSYRVTALDPANGSVAWLDVADEVVACESIVLQWGSGVSSAVVVDGDPADVGDGSPVAEDEVPVGPRTLELPVNIKVSEANERDVALVEYIGRGHPVAYYGTQLGQTATLSCSIDKGDADSLAKLREIAAFAGDVYVREPTGGGYWAHVSPSWSASADSGLVSVTLDVARTDEADPCLDLAGLGNAVVDTGELESAPGAGEE